ncbi:hypothetical protein FA15DRAFT_660952 [Coprinopsis marcescibilis]|uniref:C2H2-type domain-containing protein n=1 Tax=Coprinopsis marcescibilis TaxID=230819 RepID=A0A5C3KDM4_COPMA|nr:hypothetical protein FA15DRAFT_660952 [Coprinopsis marcescibilis]
MDGVGSYTGSSSGPFNPASYTRHFIGSPISWRAASFGMSMSGTTPGNPSSWSSRFPVGSPTHQLLSSWEAGRTPSSMESDRSSILNALNVFDREGELCRNYTCCGLHLSDLHALLEHFEEVHIVVVDSNPSQPQAHIQVPFNPQVNELSPQQRPNSNSPNSNTVSRNATAAAQFQQHFQHLANSASVHQHQGLGGSQFQQTQRQQQTLFDPDDMELELELDNGMSSAPVHHSQTSPGPTASTASYSIANFPNTRASSARSSPSSGAPSPPDTPISTPLSAYPSPQAFVPHHLPGANVGTHGLLSPYISQPSSPLSGTAASTRQSSPTGFTANGHHHGTIRPNLNINLSYPRSQLGLGNGNNGASMLTHPEEAFNAYARFASDYSSCLPGAQFNGASRDEWERVKVQQQQQQGQQVQQQNFAQTQPSFDQQYPPPQELPDGQQTQSGEQPQMSCVPPALLFAPSSSCTPASSTPGSRGGSQSPGPPHRQPQQAGNRSPPSKAHTAPATPTTATPAVGRQQVAAGSSSAVPNGHPASSSHHGHSTSNILRPAASLLLSKPFRCPKPNCNKSYKQANGLKYHMTHGSCNFAPPKDLEHVKDLLERKRREREAQNAANGVVGLNRSLSLGSSGVNGEGGLPPTLDTQLLSTYYDLNLSTMNITETELREVEREAEKRLRPFACGVGDCQRRYKNMNGLRYHYQHSGDHGAVGLALLASGQHECLQNGTHGRKSHSNNHASTAPTAHDEDRKGRDRIPMFKNHSVSVPVSRAASSSRTGTPVPVSVPVTTVSSANTSPKSDVMNMNGGHHHTSSLTTPIQVVQVQQVNGVGINTGLPSASNPPPQKSSSSSLSQALGNTQTHPGSQPGSQNTSPSLNNATPHSGQQQYTQTQQMATAYQQYAAQVQRQYQAAMAAQQQQQEYGLYDTLSQQNSPGQYVAMDMS